MGVLKTLWEKFRGLPYLAQAGVWAGAGAVAVKLLNI